MIGGLLLFFTPTSGNCLLPCASPDSSIPLCFPSGPLSHYLCPTSRSTPQSDGYAGEVRTFSWVCLDSGDQALRVSIRAGVGEHPILGRGAATVQDWRWVRRSCDSGVNFGHNEQGSQCAKKRNGDLRRRNHGGGSFFVRSEEYPIARRINGVLEG